MELILPSLHDASLAPAGKHVLSAIVQYAPYELKGGWTDAARAAFMDARDRHDRARTRRTCAAKIAALRAAHARGHRARDAHLAAATGITASSRSTSS